MLSGDGTVAVYEISLTASGNKGEQIKHGSHLIYYDIADQSTEKLNFFEPNSMMINNILDFSVTMSFDAEVIAFHVSKMDQSLSNRVVPKSSWMSKKLVIQ